MDALILSCGTGGGHNSACMAVAEELSARGHSVKTLNPYMLKSEKTVEIINNAYNIVAQRAPAAFGMAYRIGNAYRRLPVSSPIYRLNRHMASLMAQYLSEEPCDAIVTTHLFPAEIITSMKRLGGYVPKTYFIATDYACIPFTEETDCDYYIIPARELTDDFIRRGIPEEKIQPLGIPVERQFVAAASRREAAERLGLDAGTRYILIAGGSIGAGQIEPITAMLLEHYGGSVRLIIVCGNNEALYTELVRTYGERCIILGYTPHMADYMTVCDLFLSKPGGLSSTEAAVVGTPLIHITPIPGCETLNMDFFEKNGMSLAVGSPKYRLIDACERLSDAALRKSMLANQRRIIPQNAAASVCSLIERTNGAARLR